MNFFERLFPRKATLPAALREPERQPQTVAATQGRPSWDPAPLASLNPWARVPQDQNLEIYEQLIQTVPGHNGALKQICNLVGCPELKSDDKAAMQEHNDWRSSLQVNRIAVGFDCWFSTHVMNHLTYGIAAAEVVLTGGRTDVYALNELHPRTLDLRPRSQGYGLDLIQRNTLMGQEVPLNPDLILKSVHDLRNDNPWGHGLLYGSTFASEIYARMLTSLKNTWERFGVPTVVGVYKPPTGQGSGFSDPSGTKSAAIVAQAKSALQEVLRSRSEGKSKDLVMVGDWEFSLLGAEGEGLDIVGPGRHIHEQFVAAYGLPPMLLGYQWQAGERIGWVQAGLATQMVEMIRAHVQPQVEYLFRLRQALIGRPFEWQVTWKAPSLIDRGEDAKAELTEAQADQMSLKVLREEWTLGIRSAFDVARARRPELAELTDAQVRAALPDLLDQPPAPVSPFGGGGGGGAAGGEESPPPGENRPFGRAADRLYGSGVWGKNGNGRHS